MRIFLFLFFFPLFFFPLFFFTAQTAEIPQDPYASQTFHPPLHGIYMTSQNVASFKGEATMQEFKNLGGNQIIFDIQDAAGKFAYMSEVPLSKELGNFKPQIPNLAETVQKLKAQGFYVTARYVLFKNSFLARKKPAWTLKRQGTNRPFVGRDGPIWLDPGNSELRSYLIDIGREVALSGVDEIQFDYVRFPEGGKGGYVGYAFTGQDKFSRDSALTDFVAEISGELHRLGVSVGVDVFGIVVWDDVSWKVIGQNIGELGKYADAIYPMPYPSHFGYGWGGHKNPADEPYFFVQETTKKFVEETLHTGTKIRPWLQGFAMRASRFDSKYIQEQIRALTDIGIDEYSVWNARNDYRVTFKALKN